MVSLLLVWLKIYHFEDADESIIIDLSLSINLMRVEGKNLTQELCLDCLDHYLNDYL